MTGAISFAGLASGIDSGKIVDQLVAAARQPIRRLEQKQAVLDGRARRLGTLSSKLADLGKAAAALASPEKAAPVTATSSNESVFTVRGTGGGSPARYSVQVTSLATADRYYADAVAARNQTGLFGTGSLSIQVGSGTAVSVDVTGTDTLDSLASKINASGAGVTASILNTGSGYRLQIGGSQTGAANALTLTETGTTLGLNNPGNRVVTASDAVVQIDGFAVTRSSNEISGAIPGVTLDLRKTSAVGTTETVEVARDQGSLVERLRSFVNAFNAVNATIDGESSAPVGTPTKAADSLNGDSTLRTIQGRLRTLVTSPMTGASGAYTSLGSIGIAVQRGGTLALDETKLSRALAADPDAVTNLLGASNGILAKIDTETKAWSDPNTGLLDSRTDAIRAQQRTIDDQIAALERRLDAYDSQLRKQFATLETTMSSLQGQGAQLSAAMGRLSG
jgi:flagellar hook-associated protein 2